MEKCKICRREKKIVGRVKVGEEMMDCCDDCWHSEDPASNLAKPEHSATAEAQPVSDLLCAGRSGETETPELLK